MYIALNCLEFFQKGTFSVHKSKKECPKAEKIIKVTRPCYVEMKFGYHEDIGVFAKRIRKFKESKISIYKWGASFYNAPDDFSSQYSDNGDDGYAYITFDNLGLPVYCRAIHITKDSLMQNNTIPCI